MAVIQNINTSQVASDNF